MPAAFFSIPFALLCAYVLLMSLLAFLLFWIDKARAKRGAWRIRERTLLLFAFLGGAFGAWIGMLLFRHKTRHSAFNVLVPLACALWIGLLVFVALRL